MSRILRFFVCLGTLFFVGNAFAAGYSCDPSLPTYLSCQHGYYMTANSSSTTYDGNPKAGNYCQPCSEMGSNYTCPGGMAAPVQSDGGYSCPEYKKYTCCSAGYYMTKTATSTDYYGTPVVANACRPCSTRGANYTCPAGPNGCTGEPQAITINVTCPAGQYLPQGKTACTICPAGSFCQGGTFNNISLVTGAINDMGRDYCDAPTNDAYLESAAGSSSYNDCYLTLSAGQYVPRPGFGMDVCPAGSYCDYNGQKIYYTTDYYYTPSENPFPTYVPSESCAYGSYSSAGASGCTACPAGRTTSNTGSTSCDITCSNSANVSTWKTPQWTSNNVSNLCKIDSCVACTKGTGVASCSPSIVNNACTYTATCATGYKNPTCNGPSCSCELDSVTCSAGQYLPAGATSCATCPKGHKCPGGTYVFNTSSDQGKTACSGSTEYQDATGQTSCKTPSDGYYKKDDASQQVCGTGYFCKSGVRTACTTYGTGYTTDTTTASVNTQCYLNVAGGKVRNGTTGTTLNTCAAGKYKAAHKAYYGTSYACDSCPTKYPSSAASSNSELDCYVTTAAGKYVATVGAGQVNCAGTGYYCPGGTNVYSGAYGSRLTTGGRTQCPANYRNGAAAGSESGCQTSCAAGTYVATANAACTSVGTGYYRAAHSVNYGSTSTRTQCPANYRNGAATSSESGCQTSCAAGTYVAAAKAACTSVGTGYYRAGHNVNYGSTSTRTQCPAGYRDGAAAAAENGCKMNVGGGKYLGTAKGTTLSNCAAGTYKAAHTVNYGGTSSCGVCSTNTYSDAGAASCTGCATSNGYTNSGTAAASHAGVASCKATCAAGTYVATAGSACTTVGTGYWGAGGTVSQNTTLGRTQCPANYRSGAAASSASGCQTSCAAGTYVAAAHAACTSVGAGYYRAAHSVNYGSTSTRTQCPANYRNGAATSSESGCQTSCAAGTYVAAAKAACTSVGTGYYRAGHNVNYGSTSTRTQCPAGYRDGAAAAAENGCKMNVGGGKYLGTAKGTTLSNCAAGTYKAAHTVNYGGTSSCSACTGRTKYSSAGASACSTVSAGYYTTGCNSNNNNCTGQSQCTSGTWCASGVQNQCSSLSGVSVTGGTYTSAAGSSANTACKYTAPNKTITGCKTVTTNTVTYSGTAWPATTYGVTANGGYIISGNNTAAATCSQCGTAKYSAGGTATSCSSCPNADSGWTAMSPAGSTAYTACYEYQTPANCASGSVKRAASSATAYSSTISLLSTLKSKAGYYASTTATSCTICPAGSSCAASATAPTTCANWTYAASTGMSSCTACPALTSGWTKADSTGTGWKSHTNCVQISPKPANCAGGNLKQVAASNGATTWGASTVNSALSSNPGYYINGTACSACTGATYYGGGTATSCTPCPSIYTSNTTAAKSKAEQCAVQTTAGKYIATAKATEQTKCPAKNYCPSASVKYGATNSPTACPTADATTARTTYPDDYLNPTRLSINNQGWSTGLPAITSCSANYSFTNAAGHFIVESVGYNSTTGKYENGGSKYYTSVNAGWYLVDKYSDTYCNTSTNPMYYHNVAECTANSYCPGYKSMPLCSTGTHNDEMGRFACRDLGNGYNYSPAKSGAETACYLTTSNSKFVAAAGAAESACTAGGWCPGGVRVNYGSTGGRNTCPTKYPSSAASSNSELDCYVTTAAGKYVATVGAGQVNCAGTGYYCPGGTNVYSGAYGSRLTTGGRTQCPAGYRDLVATASTTKEAQCTMNVAGGKYVKVAKESAASGTCAAGYAKVAHSVTYGNTSSCAACTGTTYAENTGQASCTACPTQSGVTNISYWISTGTHTDAKGCYGFYNDVALNNGSVARIQCFWDKTKSQYDTSCGAMKDGLKCNAAYYNAILESSPTNNAAYYPDKASVIAKACTSVGKGYWSPADVYTRTQCPAGYRDGTAGVSEAQCTMNVAGGKYVAKANEAVASGTCVAGYAKAAHSVTYGNTSSCTACTGATYAASTGQASCTTCPTAKTYASAVKSYGYWNNGKDGDHTISDGCYATMTGALSNGSLTEHGCYLGTDGDYGNGGGKRCYVHQDNLKCNAGYYASTLSNGYVWNNTRAGLLGNTCVGVGAGYYSAANILTRNQCPTGLTTIGYGAGADEVTDCGRILHFGNDKLYLRSGKKTTPSLNVKIGDTTYYGNMTAGTGKGKLRLKSGTTTYSVHDDSM